MIKKATATLAAAAILAPAALADGGAATPAQSAKTASAACKLGMKPEGWAAFAAKYATAKLAAKPALTFADLYGKNAKNGKTPLGKCVSDVSKQLAAAKKAAATTTTAQTAAPTDNGLTDAEKCANATQGPGAKTAADCMKDRAGKK